MDIAQNIENNNSTQHFDVLMELGDCYSTVGDYQSAKEHYNRAASVCPDAAGPYVGLGVIALQESKLDDADTSFRVACRLDNNCAKAFAGLAMVYQQWGDYAKAFDYYLKAMEIDPDNLTALLGLFQTSCQMGTFSQVIHYLETYLQMHPGDVSVMFSLAALYMKESRLEDSRKLLVNAIDLDNSNQDALNLLEEVERKINQNMQVKAGI